MTVDLRLGFVCYDSRGYHHLREWFTDSPDRFGAAIRGVGPGQANEITLPALDFAADFPWHPTAHRFIVVVTDEVTRTGKWPEWQRSRLEQLTAKLRDLRIKLKVIGPYCPDLDGFSVLPHFKYRSLGSAGEAKRALKTLSVLTEVMEEAGRTVSELTPTRISRATDVQPDLYSAVAEKRLRIHEV